MRTRTSVLAATLACTLAATSSLAQSVVSVGEIAASGFVRPVYVTSARDGTNRLFVVEQAGRIRVVDGGGLLAAPFLDIAGLVSPTNEQGLLSVAFHPSYATNGFFYVNYTDLSGATVVARYSVSADPDRADPASGVVLLRVVQPFTNHNGGQLQFGPNDGYLYIGMGDGGSGNDPLNHGQNRSTLHGALLRLDVDGGFPYAIPPDNPYVGAAGADEIWAMGLRNPWRFSFDRQTGDLYIGDVGQSVWEEIDFQEAGTPGGLNFGWVVREGPCPLARSLPCAPAPAAFTDPIAFYGRSDGASVTGGYVYRGADPSLEGRYFYGDFISGRVWSLRKTGSSPATWSRPILELRAGFNVSSFGEDEAGELYVADYFGGTIRRLRAFAPPVLTSPAPESTLAGRRAMLSWDRGETPVQEWWIYAGSSPGGAQYFDSGSLGASTSVELMGLPTNGSDVHVRLWYRVDGLWRFSDFRYLAANIPPGTPAITSPSPGATLGGRSVVLEWTDNFSSVSEWWLYAGSTLGGNDYFDSRSLGSRLSTLVTGLPDDGRAVHVRLWYRILGVWQFVDATYTAATVARPAITAPLPGSTLPGASAPFQWTANGESVDEWWIYAGSVPGGKDFFDSRSLGSALSANVTGLPTIGGPVHVRLWYRVGTSWRFRDHAYVAALLVPVFTSPAPGSTLAGSSVDFTWTANGYPVTEWWIYAGASPGAREYFDSGSLGAAVQSNVTGLPTNGSAVHVRLWYRVRGLWQHADYAYTASP